MDREMIPAQRWASKLAPARLDADSPHCTREPTDGQCKARSSFRRPSTYRPPRPRLQSIVRGITVRAPTITQRDPGRP